MQPPLMETRIQSSGRLRSRHLPALYLDPSFFARYVAAAVSARPASSAAMPGLPVVAADEAEALREIARRLRQGTLGLTAVASAFTLLRWMQETAAAYRATDREAHHAGGLEDSDFEGLRYQGWLNQLIGDALDAVLQVDVQGLGLSVEAVWDEVPALTLLDGADRCTLHALAARHLGCTHLATVAPEMARICELLQPSGGPQPLLGAAAVLAGAPEPTAGEPGS